MFEYLDPDAAGASNLPPAYPAHPHPRPERVRHLVYGSRAGILHTIKLLHACGYADPNDWSDPIPVPPGGDGPNPDLRAAASPEGPWMAILTKTLRLD